MGLPCGISCESFCRLYFEENICDSFIKSLDRCDSTSGTVGEFYSEDGNASLEMLEDDLFKADRDI